MEAKERLGDIGLAVEFRNNTWFNEKNHERTINFLEKYQIPFVMVDEPQTKTALPPFVAVTSPNAGGGPIPWPAHRDLGGQGDPGGRALPLPLRRR